MGYLAAVAAIVTRNVTDGPQRNTIAREVEAVINGVGHVLPPPD